MDPEVEKVVNKAENGLKLSNKEKRILDKYRAKEIELKRMQEDMEREVRGGLDNFSLTLAGSGDGTKGAQETADSDVLTCENFSLSVGKQVLFVNASLKLVQGRRYGMLGPNGLGKTTLLRHLAEGRIPVPGNWDVLLVEQEAKASDMSVVDEVMSADVETTELIREEQSLLNALEDENMDENEAAEMAYRLSEVGEQLESRGADQAESRVRKILSGLGFTLGSENRFGMERQVKLFSGGWRMRISLAKALYVQPKLLLLDEPSNHLDLDAVLWLDNYLSTEYPHCVLVVSHDADFLDSVCTDIIHLHRQKLDYYRGAYSEFEKMRVVKRREEDKLYKQQQDFLKKQLQSKPKTDAMEATKRYFKIESLDTLMERPRDYVVRFEFLSIGNCDTMGGINMDNVSFSYDTMAEEFKSRHLLNDISCGIDCRSRIAVVGPNGVGKTTYLQLMLKNLEPIEGEVIITKNVRIRQYSQHFEEILPLEKSPVEYLRDEFDITPEEKCRAVLGQFGLQSTTHLTRIRQLSGGQKARVAFAALCQMRPHIMILDEPTNHLDIESVQALIQAIKKFEGGLVLVSHDARLIEELDCDLFIVNDGTVERYDKRFKDYRDRILREIGEREEEQERLAKKLAEEKAERRRQLVAKHNQELKETLDKKHAEERERRQKKLDEEAERMWELEEQRQAEKREKKEKKKKDKEKEKEKKKKKKEKDS